jgi:hypothetical protein
MLTGVAIEVPLLALTIWVLAQLGVGDPDVGLMRIVRLTTVFAGVAALCTAGGIGSLAASVSVERGRGRAVFVAARAHAIASAGLVLIAAIPHGHLPTTHAGWATLAAAGLVPGAVCGALIGFVCGGVTPVGLADVWSLATRPSEALRQLLDPKDLVKLGAALRTRTSNLFEGIFEPGAPAPKQPPAGPKASPAVSEPAVVTAPPPPPPATPPTEVDKA